MQTRETLLGRRLVTLAAMSLALLILIGATGRPGLLRLPSAWLNEALAPVEVTLTEAQRAASTFWGNVAQLWSLRQQNAQLRAQVAALQGAASSAAELRAEDASLTSLLHLQSSAAAAGYGGGIAAAVVGHGADSWWDVLVVGKGSGSGVRSGMVAVTPAGALVGEVEPGVGPTTARVMLLTNPEFGVGVQVERAGSRAQGVAIGQVGNPLLTLTFFDSTPDVRTGDVLVTSGLNSPGTPGGFPAGIPVASVTAVASRGFGLMRQAVAAPTANLDSVSLVLLLPAPAGGAGG